MDFFIPDDVPVLLHGLHDDIDHIRRLVSSSEPAVVFASLANLCVPVFSDRCSVNLTEEGSTPYRIICPHEDEPSPDADRLWTIATRFESAQMEHWRTFTGVVRYTWQAHEPTRIDKVEAERLTRRAVANVERERAGRYDASHGIT